MDTVTLGELLLPAAASALVGFSKTAISGANTVSLAVFAAVLPARESTGVILPLLIAGDVLAVLAYRRHAHWPTLLRLLPAVAVGVVLGTVFLAFADDTLVRICIGAALLGFGLWRLRPGTRRPVAGQRHSPATGGRTSTPAPEGAPGGGTACGGPAPVTAGADRAVNPHRSARARLTARAYGVAGGFTTMVANAAGPVMSLYLLSAGFRKLSFLGTSAWFFLIVNVCKVPFSAGLGLIDRDALVLDAALLPCVLPGALLGRICVGRLPQRLFERLVLAAAPAAGLNSLGWGRSGTPAAPRQPRRRRCGTGPPRPRTGVRAGCRTAARGPVVRWSGPGVPSPRHTRTAPERVGRLPPWCAA